MARCNRKTCIHNEGGRCNIFSTSTRYSKVCGHYEFDIFSLLVNKPIWFFMLVAALIATCVVVARVNG